MVALYAITLLYVGNDILLIRRCNAEFANGLYSMVGGKVEKNETARHAARREIYEEIGIDLPEDSLELVHTLHRKGTESEFVAFVFKADITGMEFVNKEPEKHDAINLFSPSELPDNMIPAHKQAINCILKNVTYSEHGW